jgi:hypothetical protein
MYKLTPINQYWFDTLFTALLFWKTRKSVTIRGGSMITDCPKTVTLTHEVFGDSVIEVEELDVNSHV